MLVFLPDLKNVETVDALCLSLSLSLHRGCGSLRRPEQTSHHCHDAQLRGEAWLEHLRAGDTAAQHAGHRRDQSHPNRMR